jgi:hypothetical protein
VSNRSARDGQGPQDGRGRTGQWIFYIPLLGVLGIAVTVIYVLQLPSGTRLTVFGTAMAIAGAAALAGGIVGFLFGIPHTIQGTAAPTDSTQYQGNTNLEQVSDWLTKIIVGVGLVQIGRALPALARLGTNLKAPLGGLASSPAFGLGLSLSYLALGFLFLYLWARERFPRELQLAATIQVQLARTESARSDALIVVNHQLSSLKGGTPPTQDELNQAIAKAPDSTRILIFDHAELTRRMNREHNPALMALTIPVFRALIAADPGDQYHRSHGSLGWALKDKPNSGAPEWQEASDELSKAITIRDRQGISGWKLYEANRAVCNIRLLRQLPVGDPKILTLTALIHQDLAAAETDAYARPMVSGAAGQPPNPEIADWRILNPAL